MQHANAESTFNKCQKQEPEGVFDKWHTFASLLPCKAEIIRD